MRPSVSTSHTYNLFDQFNAIWNKKILPEAVKKIDLWNADSLDSLNRACWSEGRLGAVMSKYLKRVSEPDLRRFIRRHMLDEGKHYRLEFLRLREFGIDNSKYHPHPAFEEKFEVAESFDTVMEMYAFHPMVGEKVGGILLERLADKLLREKDHESAITLFNDVLPDETQHTIYAPQYTFAKYVNKPEIRDRVVEAFNRGLEMSLRQYQLETNWSGHKK